MSRHGYLGQHAGVGVERGAGTAVHGSKPHLRVGVIATDRGASGPAGSAALACLGTALSRGSVPCLLIPINTLM